VLGDTLTGGTPPALLAAFIVFAVAGAAGLWLAIRRQTRVAEVPA
jgi:lipopolysaccharide export LptBFGC system permease protein LptF